MRTKGLLLLALATMVLLAGCGPNGKMTIQERKATINEMAQNTLNDFFQAQPALRERVQSAPGYGVFSNANVSVIFATGGGGYGVVTNNVTGERTYMRAGLGGLGLGLGAKDYRELMIFNSPMALEQFVRGEWSWGGQASATAKAGEMGAARAITEDVGQAIDVYTLTDSGLSAELMATGTRYWTVDELNQPQDTQIRQNGEIEYSPQNGEIEYSPQNGDIEYRPQNGEIEYRRDNGEVELEYQQNKQRQELEYQRPGQSERLEQPVQ